MKYSILPTCLLLLISCSSRSQIVVEKDALPAPFTWQLSLPDAPYMHDAAQTEAIRSSGGYAGTRASAAARHYSRLYRNLSMEQTTEMARKLHGSLYYGHNALWYRLIKPTTTGRYILNRVVANAAALGTDYLAIKLPYGYAFLHEEYHRAVMTTRHSYSYDEVWKFGKGLDIAVTQVKDEDLIYLKRRYPADQVRLSAAGVEGEYRFLQRMQQDNFFNSSAYPMVGLSVLGTVHSVSYVNLPLQPKFNDITDSIVAHDKLDILARDFTGYDFSAWVYDLFTPHEPYEARGPWPGGVGIKRPIHAYQLTPEMKHFLRETGNMQYLNYISPFLLGINRMRLGQQLYFNFALRSLPTSFGYYAGGDLFLQEGKIQTMISLGINRSRHLRLPAFSIWYRYADQTLNKNRLQTSVQFSAWLQPKDQLFAAKKRTPGMALSVRPDVKINSYFRVFSEFSYKTKGWLWGNPYLDQNFSARMGLALEAK